MTAVRSKDLNELEWVKGEIYANVWQTERIARIDLQTGKVNGWIDLPACWPPPTYRPDGRAQRHRLRRGAGTAFS